MFDSNPKGTNCGLGSQKKVLWMFGVKREKIVFFLQNVLLHKLFLIENFKLHYAKSIKVEIERFSIEIAVCSVFGRKPNAPH
jgi:hypothetical protein